MPSHFSTLGFAVKTREDFSALAMQADREGRNIEVPGQGYYKIWTPGEGIELWAQLDQEGYLIGLNPHFNGEALMPVGLVKRVSRPDDTELDGAFFGWADPQGDAETGIYPFAFDTPDYQLYHALQLPQLVNVQLVAFAHEIKAYKNEEALRATGNKMAAESCIPSGTFRPGPTGEKIDPPKSEVIFYGHVLETALLINPFTHLSFYWARIRTLGGEVDFVADPEIVNGTITKYGIVGGRFWLSGRLK